MTSSLVKLFLRDLERLENEIATFDPEKIWLVEGNINNSAGNLCLHLCGNLQHFIGHILGGTGFERDREFEFSGKDVPVTELLEMIQVSKSAISEVLQNLPDTKLQEAFPIEVFGEPMNTEYFLIHLQGHLNYHLGQINYLRRLI